MRLLLDTGLLIDYFVRRKHTQEPWLKLRIMQEIGDLELWVSAISYSDAFAVIGRFVDSEDLLRAFAESGSFLNVCSIGQTDIERATQAAGGRFVEALTSTAAEKLKADCILVHDKAGYEGTRIPVKLLGEFIGEIEQQAGAEIDLSPLLPG